jgi:flagellar basal-body rod modification protein FlgD
MSTIASYGTAPSATNSSNGTSSSNSTSSTASAASSLTPQDFMSFMVTELQNQDPLNPTDSNTMLQQMSEIGQLQSSNTLQTDLTTMVQQNQVASASSMIGKSVKGTDANNNPASGTVTSVQVTSSAVNLTLDSGATVPMANITSIVGASTSTAGSGTSSGTPTTSGASTN